MRHSEGGPHHELHDKVAIANTPHTVLRDGLEAKLLRKEFTVNNERVTGKRARAEGKHRNAGNELLEPLEIIFEGESVGQEKVGPADGLASLSRRQS